MANVKISQLPTATSLSTADLLPIVQGGVTKQVTPDLLPVSTATATALAGKDAAGAATAAQAAAIQRINHTGTQSADTITDGTTNKAFLATERTKLAGVATAATANRTDSATDAAISTAVANLVNAAPTTLDTLGELATQLQSDESAATALTTLVGTKAPLASPTFTGTVSGVSKTMVGLGNVDNTSDAGKPVSTAQATAVANSTLNLPVNVMSANGTAVIGARNAVNASGGPIAITMPTPTAVGQHIIIERSDASATTANAITITGTIRGTANTVVTLAAVGAANEGGHYISESLTSWAIAGSIKPRAVLDAAYGDVAIAGLITTSASKSRVAGDVIYQRYKDAIIDASLLAAGPVTTTQGQYGGYRGSGTPLVQSGGYITAAPPDSTYVEGQTVGTAQFARIIIDWPSTSGATIAVVFSAAPGFPGVTGVTGSDKAGVHAVLASGYAAGPDLGYLDAYQYGTGNGATYSNHALANFKGNTTTFDFHVDKTTGRVRVFQTIGAGTATLILDYTEASITSAVSNAATFEFYDGDGTVLPAHVKYFWVSPTLDPVGNLTPVSSGTFTGPQISVYTTPGSFSVAIPAGAKTVEAVCVGGGGGGGSGASGAASTVRSGGGGGGGGGRSVLPPTDLTLFTGSTIPITVGGGGAGGAAATSASGATGGLGGQTVFGATASGPYMTATGGSLGVGGSTVQGTGGSGGTGFFNGGAGSTSSSSGGAGPAPVIAAAATGGAAGGGITTANAQSAGGNGIQTGGGPQGITIGGAAGGTAGLALAQVTVGSGLPGRGGAGGGSNLTGAGGAGGAGEIYGGGGGGGGAAVTGNASGAGGAGAGGIVVVTFR